MAQTALATVPYDDNLLMDKLVHDGVPARMLREIATLLRVDQSTLADAMRIPRRTFERRLASDAALPLDEGDRAIRVARLLRKATDVFEDPDEAAQWFTDKLDVLGDVSPLERCATDAGARAVEQTLGRIEHGVFS
jgi:putative toxin-antitoxin system antitoxin component (TIGR02293 family)